MNRSKRIMTLLDILIRISVTTLVLTSTIGRIQFQGHQETWYNLPMHNIVAKAQKNGIKGDYWEREDGCKMYGSWIICAGAKDRYGEVLETSLGYGMILDSGEFAKSNPEAIDIAVTW